MRTVTARISSGLSKGVSWLVVLGILATASGPVDAQGNGSGYRGVLDVQEKQVELQVAQREAERIETLFADGLTSEADVGRARATLEKAQLSYRKALLDLMNLESRLSVKEAVKYQSSNGEQHVRVTIVNHTPALQAELDLLEDTAAGGEIFERFLNRSIRDVSVSLRDAGVASPGYSEPIRGATIALPYEQFIEQIEYLGERTLDFRLLRDVSAVLVRIETSGSTEETALHLQQAEGDTPLRVVCSQSSLEADIGSSASYALRFVRSSIEPASFQLKVLNLPRQIGASFIDSTSEARLNQVTFPAGVTERAVALRLYLPESLGDGIQLDQPLGFWVLASDGDNSGELAVNRSYTEQELRTSRASFASLELIPRGVGKIELSLVSLFSELQEGEALDLKITVGNRGSRRVDNVRIVAEPPLGWRTTAEPASVPSLAPGETEEVTLQVVPAADAPVGDYEIHLVAESTAFDRSVPSEEKTYRIALQSRARLFSTAAILGLVLISVCGVIAIGIRLARR